MRMKLSVFALAAAFAVPVQAQTEIQWWHSMGGALGEWVNDLAKDFNASQKDYKIVPTFKGTYDESMTAAIAAFRSGNASNKPGGMIETGSFWRSLRSVLAMMTDSVTVRAVIAVSVSCSMTPETTLPSFLVKT